MDINTERGCENCGTSWRGHQACPVCGWLDNVEGTVTICAWCPTSKALTEEAHFQGLLTTHGMCPICAAREWAAATDSYRARLAVERAS